MLRAALSHLTTSLFPDAPFAGPAAALAADWQPDSPGDYCPRCGATSAAEALTATGCPHCRSRKVHWDRLHRLGAYEDHLAGWLVDLKFHHCWQWAGHFARCLADATSDARKGHTPDNAAVVPVPLHWRRKLGRGYDQALLIARPFARLAGLPLLPVLRRVRPTPPQTSMTSQAERLANMRGAFGIAPVDLTGRTIWLVDDITTTGATLTEATRMVRSAGAERVLIAVAAVADPKHRGFTAT